MWSYDPNNMKEELSEIKNFFDAGNNQSQMKNSISAAQEHGVLRK